MNSNDLRNQIARAIKEEEETLALRKKLAEFVEPATVDSCCEFVKGYISATPIILDTIYSVAKELGMLQLFQPVFDSVFQYWTSEYDFLPDHLGLIGFCDDAYLSCSLMQIIADTPKPGTNEPLFLLQMKKSNESMKALLGVNMSMQLDNVVNQVYSSAAIQNMLSEVFNTMPLNRGLFLNSMNSQISNYELERQIDVQLGAMGIF